MNVLLLDDLKNSIDKVSTTDIEEIFIECCKESGMTDSSIPKLYDIEFDESEITNKNFQLIITLKNVRVKNEDEQESVVMIIKDGNASFTS